MNRRDLLGVLGGVVAGSSLAAIAPSELLARGRAIHRGSPGPFTPHQFATVSVIADLVIPVTDTPGAVAAKVPDFIAVIVGEWYTDEERTSFMEGLAEVDSRSRQARGKDFVDGSPADQVALLTQLDAELQALKARKEDSSKNFFERIKGLTIYGYYTSEIGMTQELHYQVIPGRYDPCVQR